ncbi:MAG: glutathione S-transferase family protein [Rubrivivax sp.]
MLELYHSPISTCSQKVRMVLAEKQLDWQSRPIRFDRADHLAPEYLKLNPNGVVPTLLHDGKVVTDSSVINEYLDDIFAERPMRPADLHERARMRTWRQYIDEVPTPSIRYPSFNAYFVPVWANLNDAEFAAYTERLPLRKHFYQKMGRTGFSKEEIDAALDRLNQSLQRMEASLADGPWLVGEQFTLADVSIMPTVVRMEDLGLAPLWADKPRVADWYRRLKARPAFAVAYMPGSRDLGPSC